MNFGSSIRKVTIGLVAMGFALSASTQFGTTRAHAETGFSAGTVTAGGVCDSSKHTMVMSSDITLDPTRFPQGAYVYSQYGYYAVDWSGYRTSDVYYTAWVLSVARPSTSTWTDPVMGPQTVSNLAFSLPDVTFPNTWGQWHVMAHVAVWNGSDYEYGWDRAMSYDLRDSLGYVHPANACYASLTN
jgi:hypothetical protein